MIIGIDGNEANVEERVGIGAYAFELVSELAKLRSQEVSFEVYLKDKPKTDMPKEDTNWKYKVFGPPKLWTQFALPLKLFLSKNRPDVFFTPSHYAPRFSPVPTVISIMDLSYVYFPDLFNKDDLYQLNNWTRYSAQKATKVITISEASKNDIIKEYALDSSKVEVTHLGIKEYSKGSKDMDELTKKYKISRDYILFVGTLQPRKNIVRLIEAYSLLDTTKAELVIVGKRGWQFEEILETPKKLDIKDKVKFLEFVDSGELPRFYKNALFLVLPSLYEGFGLPIVEAMKHGCPVITSNVSSMPEAGGDAALYIDPRNTNDIKEKMEKLLESPDLREELRKKGYEQAKKFSWEKTAKDTLKVLTEVVNAR